MASVFDVAEYILEKIGYVSTMKLQKLAFYSQAYSLVLRGRTLFEADFQAWANGPVCPALFKVHKGMFIVGRSDLQFPTEIQKLSSAEAEIVDLIIEKLGQLNGGELSDLTHSERPWIDARKGCVEGGRCQNVISKQSIKTFYGSSDCKNVVFEGFSR